MNANQLSVPDLLTTENYSLHLRKSDELWGLLAESEGADPLRVEVTPCMPYLFSAHLLPSLH